MKKKISFLVYLSLIPLLFSFSAKAQGGKDLNVISETNKVALVIGNSNYQNGFSRLNSPKNDANGMGEALKRLGFRLVGGKVHLDTTYRQMNDLLDQFTEEIKRGGVGFFYFSGHGSQDNGKDNFLIPVDTPIKYQGDLKYQALKVEQITSRMEEAENRLNILVLDACRNNPLPSGFKSGNKGLNANASIPSGIYIAFAARDGQVAADGDYDGYSLYTRELLKNIETKNERLEDIFINTRIAVKKETKNAQSPIDYGSIDGKFYIAGNSDEKINSKSAEEAFWNSIENSKNISDFEEYLRRTTNGEFSGIYKSTAELKLIRLKNTLTSNSPLIINKPEKNNSSKVAWTNFRPLAKILSKFTSVGSISDELIVGYLNGNTTAFDKNGKRIFEADLIKDFSETLFAVRRTIKENDKWYAKWGYVDKNGKIIIPFNYGNAESFSEGLAAVELADGKWGYIDKSSEIKFAGFRWAESFSEGLAAVKYDDWGFIDKNGKFIISTKYEKVEPFREGLSLVMTNDGRKSEFSFIDKFGKVAISLNYTDAKSFAEERSAVYAKGKWGFINKMGVEIVPLQYDFVESYSEGLTVVFKGTISGVNGMKGKFGFIDKDGKLIIPLKFDFATSFVKGVSKVSLNNKYGLIDKTGKEIIPIKYDDVWYWGFINEGFIGVILNGKKGFVDIYGNEYFDF